MQAYVGPHPPQFALLLVKSTHAPLHATVPVSHLNEQTLATQAGCALVTLVAHAVPHALQLAALLVVSTQLVPQRVALAGHPELHWVVWDPLESTCRHASLSIL